MTLETIEVSGLVPAAPEEVFAAWMTTEGHRAFTGEDAAVEPRVGARHRAWGGYIHGWVLGVGPGLRALFAWRTAEFAPNDADSLVDVLVEPAPGGCRVTVRHTDIPAGQGERYAEGWHRFYFQPLTRHFSAHAGG